MRSHGRAMLLCGCAGSSNARFASGGKTSFCFHPVQLHLALPHLVISLRLQCLVVLLACCAACRENVGPLLLEAVRPMGHLGRMHPVDTGSCMDGFEPFERFECSTGFQLCTVLFPLCRHRPAPPLPCLWTQHSILITCPVFGVHYIPPPVVVTGQGVETGYTLINHVPNNDSLHPHVKASKTMMVHAMTSDQSLTFR